MSTSMKSKVFALALLASFAVPASFAGFNNGNKVTLGGEDAFRIMGSAEGFSPEKRAWHAQDALDNALVRASSTAPAAVTVQRMNGAFIVALDGYKVATADGNSAQLEGCSPEELAHRWADSIRNFLSDSSRADNYIASLKNPHQVDANVAMVERRLYAPAGLKMAVRLDQPISFATVKAGDVITGTVREQCRMGNYAIPAGAVVTGKVVELDNDAYSVSFTTLRLPSGTEVAINAGLTYGTVVATKGPHLVSTYAIPSGHANGIPEVAGRIPASVALGAVGANDQTTIVMHRGSDVLTIDQPLAVVLQETAPITVVSVGGEM
ncbi:MAG: hypothetical protein IT343_12430 [Candidatus Melainabacteria bacterium]|nr:hypothetical protein [Candidatus Melainabacteria bacterium]